MPRGRTPIPIADRFWPKVDKLGPDDCWIWNGSEHGRGYGGFSYQGRSVPAQRIAWMLEYGDPPRHLFVCHRCDVPKCVNPAHLFLGTHQDNMDDMAAKGRGRSDFVTGTINPQIPYLGTTARVYAESELRLDYTYDAEPKKDGAQHKREDFSLSHKIYSVNSNT